jgi:hypothetical protein
LPKQRNQKFKKSKHVVILISMIRCKKILIKIAEFLYLVFSV